MFLIGRDVELIIRHRSDGGKFFKVVSVYRVHKICRHMSGSMVVLLQLVRKWGWPILRYRLFFFCFEEQAK